MQARVWIAAGLAAGAVGCSSVTARAGLPQFPCGPPTARTLALTHLARAYALRGEVYACAHGGHSYDLGSSHLCMSSNRVGPIALSGTVAAYGAQRCGVDTGTAQVVVRRLTGGTVLHTATATSRVPGAESYQSIGSLV